MGVLPTAQASFIVFGTLFLTVPEIVMLFFPSTTWAIISFSSSLAFNAALVLLLWFGHHYFGPVVQMIGEFFLPEKVAKIINGWIK